METANVFSPARALSHPAPFVPPPALTSSDGPATLSALRSTATSGDHVIRVPRWPRRQPLSAALSMALIAAVAVPAGLTVGGGPWILAVATLLAGVGRLAFEGPTCERASAGLRAWLAGAARAATVVVAVGWWLAELAGRRLAPEVIATSWSATALVLVAAAALRRAEVAYRTGTRLFVLGGDAQAADLRFETALRGDLEVISHRDPAGPLATENLVAELRVARATVLILSEQALRSPEIVQAAIRANLAGIRVRDLRSFYEQELGKVAASELSLTWFLFDIAAIHRRRIYGTTKRAVEGLVAGLLLLATAPLFPVIALAIKLASPGPVLFRQPRVGLDGRCFTLAKFRTMHARPGGEHGRWADAAGDRVFAVGRLLRRLRLDELPQLVSVLRGELSLVGPRPEQPAIVERLERQLPFYAARHTVRPGLTGWAQVNLGYAGSDAGTLAKLQYDLYYIKHQGLLLDLRVMASTARAIVLGSGS